MRDGEVPGELRPNEVVGESVNGGSELPRAVGLGGIESGVGLCEETAFDDLTCLSDTLYLALVSIREAFGALVHAALPLVGE